MCHDQGNTQPPTEKLHHIMVRTSLFVSNHGGQSEIVLRVKQGDNPTFGFLMPDHHLHPYFRFLVDHPELLSPDKSQDKDEKAMQEQNEKEDVAGGALFLLGSVYGSVEDEDADAQSSYSKDNEPGNSTDTANFTPDHVAASSGPLTGKDEAAPKQQPSLTSKENFTTKKAFSVNVVHSGAVKVKKRAGEVSVKMPVSVDKAKVLTNLSRTSKTEPVIMEPPSDMKRVIEKIVEYIMKNGKEFEAILMEQDSTNVRFPFLLASNQYHLYYLKVLRNAQESKQAGKGYSSGQASSKRSAHDKDTDTALSKELAGYDLPYESYDNKKEKFKMVIGGPKKDSQDPPQKPTPQQVGVSVDAVAAILEAARRGVRNPNLDILRPSLVDTDRNLGGERAPTSSFGDRSSVSKPFSKEGSPASSSEASLTKEQKLKAERLKRAKMFAAMIKSSAVPRLSAELPDSVSSGSVEKQDGSSQAPDTSKSTGAEAVDPAAREREGSSLPMDTSNKMENPEQKNSDDYFKDHKSKKKRHLRSRRVEDDDDDNSLEEGELDHKDNKKRHRSHHSSHRDSDSRNHRKRHSSSRDRESRHRRKHYSSSEDDHDRQMRSDKHSSRSERNSAEHGRRRSYLVEDTGKMSKGVSREASVDLLNDRWEGSAPSTDAQPSDSTTEVPSDLRAKVRAMLLATL
ncbi:hypothetical protein Sjap_025207 [Stephania japonica]|uniref:SURP motif domain-containing protein n=1 Tax=Stephania japonica TaxID=461633 RepID=A0AAP0HHR6_9MAGN